MKRLFILFFVVGLILGTVLNFTLLTPKVEQAEATVSLKGYVCHCEKKDCQTLYIALPGVFAHLKEHRNDYPGKCKEPEVTPTPTEEPTPTPTEEPTPTPTEEVTPTPTETQDGGTPPTFAGSSTEAPGVCPVKDIGGVANINVKETGNRGELEVQWSLPTNADKVHIEYGLEQNATYALLNTDNDGNEVIRDLVSGNHYWFRVAGVRGCGVGAFSSWFDPIVP